MFVLALYLIGGRNKGKGKKIGSIINIIFGISKLTFRSILLYKAIPLFGHSIQAFLPMLQKDVSRSANVNSSSGIHASDA